MLRREVASTEAAALTARHVAGRLHGLAATASRSVVCPCTNTPDGDFLIARLPESDRVTLVSACSGHGFKHSAGLGERVAEAVVTGQMASLAPMDATRFAPSRRQPA